MSYYDNMSVDLKACDTFGHLNSIPPHVPIEAVRPSVRRQAVMIKNTGGQVVACHNCHKEIKTPSPTHDLRSAEVL